MSVPTCIPAPPFGLTEQPKPMPSPWSAPITSCYYVDENLPTSTDVGNPFGTPAKPRKTIPTTLPAGSTVFVHGQHTHAYSSPNTILAQGTQDAPVFIVGVGPGAPRFTAPGIELTGTFAIVTNCSLYSVALIDPRAGGQASRSLVLRGCEIAGDTHGGGVAIGIWHGGRISGCVIDSCDIHDTGDVAATTDQDCHGVAIGGGDHHWVTNTVFFRCSGDGVQVNGGNGPGWANLHHVFVGGCQAWYNRQSGFWSKQAADVIFAGNIVRGMRPNSGGPGIGVGGQYGPDRLWLIGNDIADCEYGVRLASYEAGFGSGAVVLGNVLHDLHKTTDPTGGCALFLEGGVTRLALHNTVTNCDRGVLSPAAAGLALVADGLFSGIGGPCVEIEVAGQLVPYANQYDVVPTFVVGGTSIVLDPAMLAQTLSIIAAASTSAPANAMLAALDALIASSYQGLYGAPLSVPSIVGATRA